MTECLRTRLLALPICTSHLTCCRSAAVFDACGMAGGNSRKVGGEAKYSLTQHAKQG